MWNLATGAWRFECFWTSNGPRCRIVRRVLKHSLLRAEGQKAGR